MSRMLIRIRKIKPAFVDERGKITNVLDAPIKHVALITSKAGSIRANHYHPKQVQNDYLIKGRYEYLTKDLKKKNAKVESNMVEAGDLVFTPPNVVHAMKFLEDSIFLTLTTGPRDSKNYKAHTIKFKLL